MSLYITPGATFEAVLEAAGDPGLVGDIGLLIVDNQGAVEQAFSVADIVETPAGSGVYAATRQGPFLAAQYTIVWKLGSTGVTFGVDDLFVAGIPVLPPVAQPSAGGLCGAWTDGEDVAACCSATAGSDSSLFDTVALEASVILNDLTGRRYPGICSRTVRPCATRSPCSFQVLSRGHVVGWAGGAWSGDVRPCGCAPLSRVKLAGYPVQAISGVLIDGVAVDPSLYRLDGHRWLTRLANPDGTPGTWPSCQRLDLADTEPGTFSVEYLFGAEPSLVAVAAATELACELWKACPGNVGECSLPSGTVRVIRQGVTIERKKVATFIAGAPTGLVHVDAFLAAEAAKGPGRRSAVWSPDTVRYAKEVG